MGAYAASKAGVLRLTESLAEEEKNAGVRVNAVLPTIIDTPRNRADMPKADFSRWVKPEEIAKAILFLLSNDATAITGAEISDFRADVITRRIWRLSAAGDGCPSTPFTKSLNFLVFSLEWGDRVT